MQDRFDNIDGVTGRTEDIDTDLTHYDAVGVGSRDRHRATGTVYQTDDGDDVETEQVDLNGDTEETAEAKADNHGLGDFEEVA